jgi:hypothetical protein
MSGTNEFTLSTLCNLISFIGIMLLLFGVNPIVGGSLVAIGLVAFSLLIVFHKV